MKALWDTCGAELAFNFTPPAESTAIKVRFRDDTLAHALEAKSKDVDSVYSSSFTLEELFTHA